MNRARKGDENLLMTSVLVSLLPKNSWKGKENEKNKMYDLVSSLVMDKRCSKHFSNVP